MDKDTEIETDKVIHAIKKWQPHKMRNAKTEIEREKLEKKHTHRHYRHCNK